MVASLHCPNPTAANELGVPSTPGPTAVSVPAGSKRGIVVWFHGLSINAGYPNYAAPSASPFNVFGATTRLLQALLLDGWIIVQPQFSEDGWPIPPQAIYNDMNADTGKGSRYQLNWMRHWAHIVEWCRVNYPTAAGAVRPIVAMGGSWGGWHTLQIAANATGTIAGYVADISAVQLWAINYQQFVSIGANVPNYCQSPVTTTISGTPSMSNTPFTINTGTNPITAGFASSGLLVIINGTNNATNWLIVSYTGITTSSFTGCQGPTVTGVNGATIQQSSFTSGFDLSLTCLNNLGNGIFGTQPPGLVGWETADNTAGFAPSQAVYNNAVGTGVNVVSSAGGGAHLGTDTWVANVMAVNYNNGTTYQPGQYVLSGGNAYYCIATSTGNTPPNASFWSSSIGAQATQGIIPLSIDPLCPLTA